MQISGYGNAGIAQQVRERLFTRADANGDGGLNIDEFESVVKSQPGGTNESAGVSDAKELFGRLDGDSDGQLSRSELDAGRPPPSPPGRPPLSQDVTSTLLQSQEEGETSELELFLNDDDEDSGSYASSSVSSSSDSSGDDSGLAALLEKYLSNYQRASDAAQTGTAQASYQVTA